MVGFVTLNDRAVRDNRAIDAVGPIDCHAELGNTNTEARFYTPDNRTEERRRLVAQLPFRCDIALKRFFQIRHVSIFSNLFPALE